MIFVILTYQDNIAQAEETKFLQATTDPQQVGRQNMLVKVTTMINEWKDANPNGGMEEFLQTGNQLKIDALLRGEVLPGHEDITGSIDKQLAKIGFAAEKMATLRRHYGTN